MQNDGDIVDLILLYVDYSKQFFVVLLLHPGKFHVNTWIKRRRFFLIVSILLTPVILPLDTAYSKLLPMPLTKP